MTNDRAAGGTEDVSDRSEFLAAHEQDAYFKHREAEKAADAERVAKIATSS